MRGSLFLRPSITRRVINTSADKKSNTDAIGVPRQDSNKDWTTHSLQRISKKKVLHRMFAWVLGSLRGPNGFCKGSMGVSRRLAPSFAALSCHSRCQDNSNYCLYPSQHINSSK